MMEPVACFEDEEFMPMHEDDLVAAVGEALDTNCSDEDLLVGTTIPRSFFGTRRQGFSLKSYVKRLYQYLECSKSVFVTALIYLERIRLANPSNRLTDFNVHRMFSTAILLALKYHDDEHYSNSYYAEVFGMRGLNEINHLEAKMLTMLEFRLGVTEKEYTYCKNHLMRTQIRLSAHSLVEFNATNMVISAA
eukprot:CAMPEP_0113960346 /NCGR_PEP_ID=MMETSP0011_2-20120614/4660_1 /TAXON_ID=101924 /ORGANISM="Rhodosorus marinus" /LENGTH=191 /DNA_ID=CAMNT_0000971781 /DNA_START=56 /DNA_END=631 /DNA_ORIENTATION=+ /assembly_acc=CAM_ASM_000156